MKKSLDNYSNKLEFLKKELNKVDEEQQAEMIELTVITRSCCRSCNKNCKAVC